MKLKRRERAAAIVLLLVLVGLAFDRLLAGPRTAEAGIGTVDSTAGNDASSTAAQRAGVAAESKLDWINDFLSDVRADSKGAPETTAARAVGALPDVFDSRRIPRTPAPQPETPVMAEGPPADTLARANLFRAQHSLAATILGPDSIALVGERTLRVGDAIDGFVLKSVQSGSAVFISDGMEVVLRVPARSKNR